MIPDSVTHIGKRAFKDNNITELTLGSGLTVIEDNTFSGNEIAELTIPDSVAEIGANAFADNKIRTLDIPATVEYPGKGSFKYNYINTLTLHGGIEVIEDRAFYNNYFGEVKIPNTAEYLGRYSFGYKDGKSSYGNYRTIEKINDFKIIGIDYSKADTYAEANGFKFESATTSRTPGDSSSSEPEEVVYDTLQRGLCFRRC